VRAIALRSGSASFARSFSGTARNFFPGSSFRTPAGAETAQPQQVHFVDYSRPRSAFPNLLQPYLPRPLAEVNLSNSARIDSLLQDGKIYLSIDDAIALALENNLDLEIARYNLNIVCISHILIFKPQFCVSNLSTRRLSTCSSKRQPINKSVYVL